MHLLTSFILLTFSCLVLTTCNKNVKPQPDPVQTYANEKFGDDYAVDYNANETYVIISKAHKNRPSDPYPTLQFEVLEVKTMEALFNDNLRGGTVKWIRDYVLEAEALRGIPNPDDPKPKNMTYRYNVQKRKKFTGGFFD